MLPPVPPDRRRDRRHAVTGQATLRPHRGGADLFGGIMDVSAGGVRLRIRPGHDLTPGTLFDVSLEVALPTAPQAVPPVRLCGAAVTVRAQEIEGPAHEVALRFMAPLSVSDGFDAPHATEQRPEPSVPVSE